MVTALRMSGDPYSDHQQTYPQGLLCQFTVMHFSPVINHNTANRGKLSAGHEAWEGLSEHNSTNPNIHNPPLLTAFPLLALVLPTETHTGLPPGRPPPDEPSIHILQCLYKAQIALSPPPRPPASPHQATQSSTQVSSPVWWCTLGICTQEADTAESLQICIQPGLHSESQARQHYIVRPCVKQGQKQKAPLCHLPA